MEKFLEEILKSDVLNEETKAKLREQIAVFEEQVRVQARKDIAEQYKKDRDKLINAVDKMVTESLNGHLKEFAEDVKHVQNLKQKHAKAIVEANKKAAVKVSKALEVMETRMDATLASEMKDLLEDRRVERQAVANVLKEAKERSEREHQEFVKKGAKVMDFMMEKEVRKLLTSLHKDIIAARQNNFGRKIFESFMAEYENSLFSHDAHSKKLQKEVIGTSTKLTKLKEAARTEIVRLREELNEAKGTVSKLEENNKKTDKMGRLLRNLKGDARIQMKELLEAAPYAKLETTFKKFLPVVTEQKQATKPKLKEKPLGSFHAGAKRALNEAQSEEEIDNDLISLQKRAGILR